MTQQSCPGLGPGTSRQAAAHPRAWIPRPRWPRGRSCRWQPPRQEAAQRTRAASKDWPEHTCGHIRAHEGGVAGKVCPRKLQGQNPLGSVDRHPTPSSRQARPGRGPCPPPMAKPQVDMARMAEVTQLAAGGGTKQTCEPGEGTGHELGQPTPLCLVLSAHPQLLWTPAPPTTPKSLRFQSSPGRHLGPCHPRLETPGCSWLQPGPSKEVDV